MVPGRGDVTQWRPHLPTLVWLPPAPEGAADVPHVFTWLGPPDLAKTWLPPDVNATEIARSETTFALRPPFRRPFYFIWMTTRRRDGKGKDDALAVSLLFFACARGRYLRPAIPLGGKVTAICWVGCTGAANGPCALNIGAADFAAFLQVTLQLRLLAAAYRAFFAPRLAINKRDGAYGRMVRDRLDRDRQRAVRACANENACRRDKCEKENP